jgi:hypothetical protein
VLRASMRHGASLITPRMSARSASGLPRYGPDRYECSCVLELRRARVSHQPSRRRSQALSTVEPSRPTAVVRLYACNASRRADPAG